MSDAPPDRIELRGIRAEGIHGVLPQEQAHAQPFEVDLDIVADLWDAGVSDLLADTVDYGTVIERTVQVISAERHDLIERIAERIADEVLDFPGVLEVTVTVRKLRVPVDAQITSAGVRITRT
ncbi:MAG TPA: dihydroneopterin aldolase [Acidimicrobiales bacterium]|nr:dihydroneopterin aldolase [Acidimicrobiales bacterium]